MTVFSSSLIRRAEARRPVEIVLDVTVQPDAADPRHFDQACVEIEESAVAGLVHRLRVDHVQPQPVVQRQLGGDPPGVLCVVEMTPLPLACVDRRAHVAAERAHVAEHEARERQTAALRAARTIVAEAELAGSMPIARHAQVVGAADVDAELHAVGAPQLRDVADELKLLLVLIERTVAPADAVAEARTERDTAGCRLRRR